MDLDTLIITVFCRIDDTMKSLFQGQRLRQRGPMPALPDSEVLTMEVVGEYLGLSQDTALYRYFRQHYRHFFPGLARVHRTTFVRQAANLWKVKELVWQRLLSSIRHNPAFTLVDSLPLQFVSSPGLTAVSGSGERPLTGRIACPGRPFMASGFMCA